jgi:hypothetical protein
MTNKKHEKKHQQDQEHQNPANHSGNLADYDPEKEQDMVDVEEAAEEVNSMSHPNPDDPQHSKKSTTPGQENVPAGFDSGRGMQGGSANRRKR